MPKINVVIEQKRPLDATPERALAMFREGHIKQSEIAKLWEISPGRVSKLIAKAIKNEEQAKHRAEVMARALQIATDNQNANDSLNHD